LDIILPAKAEEFTCGVYKTPFMDRLSLAKLDAFSTPG